ncbi:MAG TPA: hypothetical protein VKZ82_11975 [Nonomuraea sp.]|uniref:hypothetical protein n=1 Tax=Nonomuraea sp. NPDC049649 TaxID=3155776 RepID=UPI002CB9CC3C|nr:hypothetical protein [Nonomuraea sp.]
MNRDDVNVPQQRADQQNDHNDDTAYREPYGDDDVLVASDAPGGRDTGPHPMPDPAHDGPDPGLRDEAVVVTEVTPAGPGPAQPAGDPPAHAAPRSFELFDKDPAELQSRWRDVQAAFVDDPSESVQRADELVGEVVEELTHTLRSRTDELRELWKSDGGDTERLRQALREYRGVLEGLLALSGQTTVK